MSWPGTTTDEKPGKYCVSIIAPKQLKNLSELGFKAMIGGAIVSLMSATIVGAIIG